MARQKVLRRRADGGRTARVVLSLLLVLVLLGPTLGVAAQEDGPSDEDQERPGPPRLLDREAPDREPEVLERTVTPEGLANVIVELPAEADTYIASEWPNQTFGSDALYLGYNLAGENNFGAQRMLLRFDILENVPQGAVVNQASLRLRLNYASPDGDEAMGTVLRRLCSSWSETDVTWNREPDWREIRARAEVGAEEAWYTWDVTGLVADWAARQHANHGMEIIGDETVQQRERAFYSRETTNGLSPRLVVDYTAFNDQEPPVVEVNALPDVVDRDFTVSWSGKDPGGSGIASYDVQYRVDGGAWTDWILDAQPPTNAADFMAGQDGRFYEFRARGEDRAGNVEAFGPPEASTTVDTQPPSTSVDALPAFSTEDTFSVSWSGHDDGAGIRYYDVRYRHDGGSWIPWQQQTLTTRATFHALRGGSYDFEARAVDELGLVEDFTGEAEASIVVDTEPPNAAVNALPVKTGDNSFTVSWSGYDNVTGIQYYDVRYRYNRGGWILWRSQTTAKSAHFSAAHGDGIYDFEARAVDNVGLQEAFLGRAEASIIVDAVPPFIEPTVWLPFVVRNH